jgi:tetratricopeptide (TPR) repeat protein
MNRIITSLCFTIFAVAVLTAQPIRDTNINQKFESAKLAEEQGNYAGAFDWYEKAYDEMRETSGRRSNPQLKRLALKLAELDYRLRDYEDAEKKYERVLKKR